MCQKLPENFEEKLVAFQRYMIKKRLEKGYTIGQIGNIDQKYVYLDMPVAYLINGKSIKEVKV